MDGGCDFLKFNSLFISLDSKNGTFTMYKISSSNAYYNGEQFSSLAAAKERADAISAKSPTITVDVLALSDRDTFRAVYTPASCVSGSVVRGTYNK